VFGVAQSSVRVEPHDHSTTLIDGKHNHRYATTRRSSLSGG